jgi:hypothetical protein
MRRRALLAGVATLAIAFSDAATLGPWKAELHAQPPAVTGGMRATITMPAQYGWIAGSYVFDESTGTQLDRWVDPRGAFTLTLRQVTRADLPGMRVIFVRSGDRRWGSVECWLGDSTTPNRRNMPLGYTLSVAGDFAGQATTPYHWWGSRWRLSGSRTNGLKPGRNDWPYPLTDYATLVADRLIPQFDPSQLRNSWVPVAKQYTPMGSSSLVTYMPMAGGRPDLGIFTEYACNYFQTQAPTATAAQRAQAPQALATLQAITEAGASIEWWIYDNAHGCMWECLVNNLGKTVVTPDPQTHVSVVATGPAGAKLATRITDAKNRPWNPPTNTKIPASGTITVNAGYGDGWWYQPMPTGAIKAGTDGDPGITYTWGDTATTYNPGAAWSVDPAHQPELGYLSYALFRDPWDLHTCQAGAMSSANRYPRFSCEQVRQVAWDYAHAAQAYVATPESAPTWVLPKSTMGAWFKVIKREVISHLIDRTATDAPLGAIELSTVYHTIHAWRPPNIQSYGGQTGRVGEIWEDSFFSQATAIAVLTNPNDADARRILEWAIHCVADRYDPASGWPIGYGSPYVFFFSDPTSSHYYKSWSEAWQANKARLMGVKPGDPMPPDPVSSPPMATDYVIHDFCSLSLAVQAGLTQYRPQRNWIAGVCRAQGVNYNRAYAQV